MEHAEFFYLRTLILSHEVILLQTFAPLKNLFLPFFLAKKNSCTFREEDKSKKNLKKKRGKNSLVDREI